MTQTSLLKSHELIQTLTEIVAKLKEDSPLSPDDGLQCLKKLLALEALYDHQGAVTIREISKRIQSELFWEATPGAPLTRSDKNKLLRACETIKIQIIAVAAWCALSPSKEAAEDFFAILESDAFTPNGAIQFGLGGLTYTAFRGNMIILFSSILDIDQSHDVLVELARVYDQTPHEAHWVMDFSGAKELTPYFEIVILSYKKQLMQSGRRLLVCWLDPKIIVNKDSALLTELELVNVGGYYFTAPRHYSDSRN